MKFSDLQFEKKSFSIKPDGKQAVVKFKNGYGASIIDDGYGSEDGLYELGILKDGALCYSTSLGNDVIGRLTPGEVESLLEKIEALS